MLFLTMGVRRCLRAQHVNVNQKRGTVDNSICKLKISNADGDCRKMHILVVEIIIPVRRNAERRTNCGGVAKIYRIGRQAKFAINGAKPYARTGQLIEKANNADRVQEVSQYGGLSQMQPFDQKLTVVSACRCADYGWTGGVLGA